MPVILLRPAQIDLAKGRWVMYTFSPYDIASKPKHLAGNGVMNGVPNEHGFVLTRLIHLDCERKYEEQSN